MIRSRRRLLSVLGVGIGTLAGCLSGINTDNSGNGNGNESDESGSVSEFDASSIPFAVRSDRPVWDDNGGGQVIIVDSPQRQSAAFAPHSVPSERHEEMNAFLDGVDYDHERLLLVESVGPNACHDRLEIDSVRIEDGEIRADAEVIDTSDGEGECAQVVTFPSALVRITFEEVPLDSATVEVTDGWGETTTITAAADDPIETDDGETDEIEEVPFEGAIRPDEDPEPVASLECPDDGIRRHPPGFEEPDLSWGDVTNEGETVQELRIEHAQYGYGDTARIRLTNVTDESSHVGNHAKYNIQVYTESGWQDVRVTDEDRYFDYTDEALGHAAGESIEWSLELTESGLVEGTYHDHAEVCPELQPGRYRFVFWGIIGGAVGVGFDLRR